VVKHAQGKGVVVKVAQRKKEHNCDIDEGRERLEVDEEGV
jgi:hypothetical protein